MLQVAAFVMARRLARVSHERALAPPDKDSACVAAADDDSDCADAERVPPGWRKKANLRMYTILDKIF